MEKYFSAVKALAPAKPDFERIGVTGFVNDGVLRTEGDGACEGRRHNATVGVLARRSLDGDLVSAVDGLVQGYPWIADAFQSQSLGVEEFVEEHWAELDGSGVWLPEYGVYLVVSRVVFYPSEALAAPLVSFLRGRIFDGLWNHLDGYTLGWDDEEITFPRIFDVPIDWEVPSAFLGPEDPRVVIEDGVPGAEPAVVFNMLSTEHGGRTMWMHRPFSNLTTAFTIRGEGLQHNEKNWAPFFHNDASPHRRPGSHLHFVYSLQPLQILRCQLLHGHCNWVYQQDPPDPLAHPQSHPSVRATLHSRTNFVPVHQSDAEINLWAGFAHIHLDGCGANTIDRPELVILANSGSDFHIIYASEAMDFGTAVLDRTARESPCDEGRLLAPNGIVRWDQDRHDMMYLTLSVGDRSSAVVPIRGVSQLVRSLPYLNEWQRGTSPDGSSWGLRWSTVGADVVGCSVMAATNSTVPP